MANIDGILFYNLVNNGYSYLLKKKQEINDLNVFPVPDGDTGNNMVRTLQNGLIKLQDINDKTDLGYVSGVLAEGMLYGARGNSGVILSQYFKGISLGLKDKKEVDVDGLIASFKKGYETAYKAVVTPTEGTILTVAREGIENIDPEKQYDLSYLFKDIIKNMDISLKDTPNKLDVLKEAGVVDSGGAGLLEIFKGMNAYLNGEIYNEIIDEHSNEVNTISINKDLFNADSEMTYGYCTEFILQLLNEKCVPSSVDVNEFIEYYSTLGDSIVAFKDKDIIKVHVHTKVPAKVIEFAQKYGEFITFKMENMAIQNNEVKSKKKNKNISTKRKNVGFVTVVQGDGLIDTFENMNVDVVLNGGQTMNTSCEEFIEAFKNINADNIIVLPNNGNILLAAKQAQSMYKDSKIHIIPTKSIAEGYFSLAMMIDNDIEVEKQIESMSDGLNNLLTGEITKAIRNCSLNNVDIKKDEYISIINHQIVSCSISSKEALLNLINHVDDIENKEIVVIFVGSNGSIEDAEEIKEYIESKNSLIDIGIIEGKQDIYDYILGIY